MNLDSCLSVYFSHHSKLWAVVLLHCCFCLSWSGDQKFWAELFELFNYSNSGIGMIMPPDKQSLMITGTWDTGEDQSEASIQVKWSVLTNQETAAPPDVSVITIREATGAIISFPRKSIIWHLSWLWILKIFIKSNHNIVTATPSIKGQAFNNESSLKKIFNLYRQKIFEKSAVLCRGPECTFSAGAKTISNQNSSSAKICPHYLAQWLRPHKRLW